MGPVDSLVDPEDESLISSEATVHISITPQNDAPTAMPRNVTLTNLSAPVIITLTSDDVDEDASQPRSHSPSFAPHSFARVTRFPRGGRLSASDDRTAPGESGLMGRRSDHATGTKSIPVGASETLLRQR